MSAAPSCGLGAAVGARLCALTHFLLTRHIPPNIHVVGARKSCLLFNNVVVTLKNRPKHTQM